MAFTSIYDKLVLESKCVFTPPKDTIDLYILAGQSNAHGHAEVSRLAPSLSVQDGYFYSSWHNSTSNAATTQYYSGIASSLVAGFTRGDSGESTLAGSTLFGPELGFVKRANQIDLTSNKIGIVKYAVGASSLVQDPDNSDWDLTATGTRDGDCWRGFQRALADVTSKLDASGYSYNWKGLIWWQGESGTSDVGLNAFIQAVRNLMRTKYEIRNPTTFPVVITGNSTNWGSTLEAGVAFPDPYIGFVDAAQYGQIDIDGTFNVHIGSGTDFDVTGNGVNDMFDIGEEYANQMFLAQTGSTPTG